MFRISPPSGSNARTNNRRQTTVNSAGQARRTLLPLWIGLPRSDRSITYDRKGKGRVVELCFYLTRRRCEDGLLLGGVICGVWQLGRTWHEVAIAGGEFALLHPTSSAGHASLIQTIRDRPIARSFRIVHDAPWTITFTHHAGCTSKHPVPPELPSQPVRKPHGCDARTCWPSSPFTSPQWRCRCARRREENLSARPSRGTVYDRCQRLRLGNREARVQVRSSSPRLVYGISQVIQRLSR